MTTSQLPGPAGDVAEVEGPRHPWLRLGVATGCQAVLAVVVCLALWAAAPAAIGWHPTTVSSGSMLPRLHVGDVAVSKPLRGTPPQLQQVLLFADPDHAGHLRLHRFVRVDDQGRMITRGDANANDDSTPITPDAVTGVAVLRVPYVALPVTWLREGRLTPVGLVAVALVLLGMGAGLARGLVAETTTAAAPRPRRHRPARALAEPARFTRPVRVAAATAALVGLTVGAILVARTPAFAAYSDGTAAGPGTMAASTYYTCDNAVLAYSPYLYYALDETSGSVARDGSGNGRNGAYQGTSTVAKSDVCTATDGGGTSTTAITLNGTNGYIATPTQLTAPNTFTVSAWFKTTTTRGGKIIGFGSARTGSSGSYDRHVYLTNTGRLVFGVGSAKATITSPDTYNDGDWHQVTASLSSAGMRLSVDGALVASSSSVTSGVTMSGYWRIGYDNLSGWPSAPTSNYLAATLEQVAVFPTALSAGAVNDLYQTGR